MQIDLNKLAQVTHMKVEAVSVGFPVGLDSTFITSHYCYNCELLNCCDCRYRFPFN